MKQARSALEEKLATLEGDYSALEERFLTRESRPEDIERIRQLETVLATKDEEIAAIKEEMRYFKLELVNREENFNKTFNRSPNVGVMQVVKQPGQNPVAPQRRNSVAGMANAKRLAQKQRRKSSFAKGRGAGAGAGTGGGGGRGGSGSREASRESKGRDAGLPPLGSRPRKGSIGVGGLGGRGVGV